MCRDELSVFKQMSRQGACVRYSLINRPDLWGRHSAVKLFSIPHSASTKNFPFFVVLIGLIFQSGLSSASGFSVPTKVELVPLGDLRIKVSNTTGYPIQGLEVKILAPELAALLSKTSYRFPGRLESGKDRVLVVKTTRQPLRWLRVMEKARDLQQNHTANNALSVSAIGQTPIYPVLQIRKQPISQESRPKLIFAGDQGSYIFRNLANESIKLGKLEFDRLPSQVKVLRDTCTNNRLGPKKTCALELTLVSPIGTLKPFRLRVPFNSLLPVARTHVVKAKAATTTSSTTTTNTETYSIDATAGAPEGIYASSCQNISFGSGTSANSLTADCIYWNNNSFSINSSTTLDYSSCKGGNLTGEVMSDPLTGQLGCSAASVLAIQSMPPNATPVGYADADGGCDNPSWDPTTQYLTCSNLKQSLYYPGCQGSAVGTGGTAESWSLICLPNPNLPGVYFSSSMTDISELTKMWGFSYLAKDGKPWSPWSTLSCSSSTSTSCPNSTGLSVYSNPVLSTSNFGFKMVCAGENGFYQVAAPPPTNSWFSGQAGLIGIGPLNSDSRTSCNSYNQIWNQAFFVGTQSLLYYNHGNTMRGCSTVAEAPHIGMSWGPTGFASNNAYWWDSFGGGGDPTSCNTLAVNYGLTPSNPNYQGQTGFGENYQLNWTGADFPTLQGLQIISPGAKYYPQYAFFMANLTSKPVTVPANSFSANYCQNVSGWETAGYVIGEALSYVMGAGIPIPGAEGAGEFVTWTMNAAGASSSIVSAYGGITSGGCSNGSAMQNVSFPNVNTTIEPNSVAFLGAKELNDFDYFSSWTVPSTLVPGSASPVTFQQTNPLVFNDGFHAILFSVDSQSLVKVTALNDTQQFSLPNFLQGQK